MCRLTQLPLRKYHLFLLLASLSGCAQGLLAREIAQDDAQAKAYFERQRITNNAKLEAIFREHPEWRNTVPDDVLLLQFYDENGKKRGSALVE